MCKLISQKIMLIWIISGFSAFGSERNVENLDCTISTYEDKMQVWGFDRHALILGSATACFLFSTAFDKGQSFPEICMNGMKATSLGIMTSYLLNFGGSALKSSYDYALETFDQKIFSSIDKKLENRIEQLDGVLENRTGQLDDALEGRIKQINNSSFGGFLHAIVSGNTQGRQE